MNRLNPNTPVTMIRRNLENIPQFELPPGITAHWYQPSDENHWVRIHELADTHNDVTLETFENQFGDDRNALKNRMLFWQDTENKTLGTITAWYSNDFQGQRIARIHWVAIIPEFQGRGLAQTHDDPRR